MGAGGEGGKLLTFCEIARECPRILGRLKGSIYDGGAVRNIIPKVQGTIHGILDELASIVQRSDAADLHIMYVCYYKYSTCCILFKIEY